jgi:hypothetical protein
MTTFGMVMITKSARPDYMIQSDNMALTVQYYLPGLCCNTGMPLVAGLENVNQITNRV